MIVNVKMLIMGVVRAFVTKHKVTIWPLITHSGPLSTWTRCGLMLMPLGYQTVKEKEKILTSAGLHERVFLFVASPVDQWSVVPYDVFHLMVIGLITLLLSIFATSLKPVQCGTTRAELVAASRHAPPLVLHDAVTGPDEHSQECVPTPEGVR